MHLNDDCIVHTLVQKFAASYIVKLTIYDAANFRTNGRTDKAILGVGHEDEIYNKILFVCLFVFCLFVCLFVVLFVCLFVCLFLP